MSIGATLIAARATLEAREPRKDTRVRPRRVRRTTRDLIVS